MKGLLMRSRMLGEVQETCRMLAKKEESMG